MGFESTSPLDAYRAEIVAHRMAGESNAGIARALFTDHDITTSEASIRRAFRRWETSLSPIATVTSDKKFLPTPEQNIEWGTGMARLVEPAGGENEVVVFLSDIHVPYHDVFLVDSAIEMIRQIQPDRVVINGDVVDFFQLSHFNKANKLNERLQIDIDEANEIRRRIREAAPNAILDENEGNHDNRIISYIENRSPALESLRALKPHKIFKYDEYHINFHPGCGFLLRPEFLVKHGTAVNQEAGASAKAELQKAGISGISGHVHRLATYRKAGYVQRQWTEQGGLMRLDPDYVKGGVPNWQQGICIGEFSNKTASFVIYEIPAVDGKFISLFDLSDRRTNVAQEKVVFA